MKKKILISSLLFGSLILIFPFDSIFMSKNSKTKNEKNEEIKFTSNILSEDNDYNTNVFKDKNYTSAYTNNLTKPVISPDKNVTGFLGAWRTEIINQFPTAIGWTTPSLFQSWSVNLEDHPSLKNSSVPSNFTPGLVTTLYSDNKYSINKRNQIFAVVANTADLDARRYWILRYNAIDGSPIKDDNAEMPKMANAPIPEMVSKNGNGSAFALTTDAVNDRYIAFYPGKLGDLKNDIFGFKLTSDNKIEWLENNKSFSGHNNWEDDVSATAFTDYKDDNFVLGLAPFNTKKNSNGASMSLMIATSDIFGQDKDNWYFRILNLNDDFSAIADFNTLPLKGRTASIFNGTEDLIKVPKSFLTLAEVQRNINPHLQLFDFIDSNGYSTHKVQMVVPIKNGDEWIYMYLSGIFDNANNWYLISWDTNGILSQGSFLTSSAVEGMPPGISYNDENPNDIIITYHPLKTSKLQVYADQFTFDTLPNNGPWDPKVLFLASQQINDLNLNWKPKNIAFKLPNNQEVMIWSIQAGQTVQYSIINDTTINILQTLNSGGINHEDFQETASSLKWLPINGEYGKSPSEISNENLETIGSDSTNFFKIPVLKYPDNVEYKLSLKVDDGLIRDDSKGVIKGIFNLNQYFKITDHNKEYNFDSKIPFKITGLNIKGDAPTSIVQNDSILNKLPSELTIESLPNYVDIISTPKDHGDIQINDWEITNQNNANGTATISVKIHPYYDDNSKLIIDPNNPKKFTTNVSGLKKISGTNIVKGSLDVSNLTVWDIDGTNIEDLIQVNDLIPKSRNDIIEYSVKDISPLTGELTAVASIAGGSYYDPNNKGLPSIVGDPPLELSIKINEFKKIPNTGTLVIPGKGPYSDIFSSSINENNIANFITIENAVPGSKYVLEITGRNSDDDKLPPSGGWVSFNIIFDKEYDTKGNIVIGTKREYTIEGFEILEVVTENNFIPIIAGSVGGGILLLILIILLILLIINKKGKKPKISNSPPQTSEIVLPIQGSIIDSNKTINQPSNYNESHNQFSSEIVKEKK